MSDARRIGPYEVVAEVGRGGMGTVFRARSPGGAGEHVALKVLRQQTPEARARFEREVRLLGALGEAEGFVPLLATGEDASGPWLTMPFVSGGTLRARLESGLLAVSETIALGRALARAVAHAHARGIVHRDLKPENILFTATGKPLVADLGLAKHFLDDAPGGRSVSLSCSLEFRGSAAYCAPEQLVDAKNVGPAADVYALGAVLHECLSGRPPYEGQSFLDLVGRIQTGHRPSLRSLRRDAPAWLVATIERALRTEPAKRFADASELARALDLGASRRRGRRALLGLGALLVVTLAAAAWAVDRRSRALVDELVGQGVDAGERGDLDVALRALDRAIALDPRRARALANRGGVWLQKGDPGRALADLDRALAIDPKDALARLNRGALRMNAGDSAGALADLDRAIELDPREGKALRNRAGILINLGQLPRALRDLDAAVALAPDDVELRIFRGVTRSDLHDDPGARSDFEHALVVDPRNVIALVNRAQLERDSGDPDAALRDLNRAIELAPATEAAFYTRALLAGNRGDQDAAIADYDRCLELAPRMARTYSARGSARSSKGDKAGALADYDRAIELDPRYGPAYRNRASLRREAGDATAAIADYQRAAELSPENALAWNDWGMAQLPTDPQGALTALEKAVTLAPGYYLAVVNRGLAKEALGDRDGAIADFERALALRDSPELRLKIEALRAERR